MSRARSSAPARSGFPVSRFAGFAPGRAGGPGRAVDLGRLLVLGASIVVVAMLAGSCALAPARGPAAPAAAVGDGAPLTLSPHAGWRWAVEPLDLREGTFSRGGLAVLVRRHRADLLQVAVAHPQDRTRFPREFRAVALDAAGEAVLPDSVAVAGSELVGIGEFVFRRPSGHPLLPRLGIEVLTAEGRRDLAASARREARARGLDVLPFPELEQPYEFALTTVAGERIDSGDLRGRAVVLHHWSRQCGPCQAAIPALDRLAREYPDRLTVIVFDHGGGGPDGLDAAGPAATAGNGERPPNWLQVRVPPAERSLWSDASTVRTLPRTFVVDRSGELVGDVRPAQLEDLVRGTVTGYLRDPRVEYDW
ncbi:MAG: hypothetical protein R6X25_13935 [Candidatus Krumholzibacteriia bacterium]